MFPLVFNGIKSAMFNYFSFPYFAFVFFPLALYFQNVNFPDHSLTCANPVHSSNW